MGRDTGLWEIGISTGIAYRHPIEDVLEPISAQGIRTIEVSTAPQHIDLYHHGGLKHLAERIAVLGLRVHALHAPFGHDVNITSPDPGLRDRSLDRLKRAADALALLGGGLFVIHPGGEDQRWAWEREARMALSVDSLARVYDMCLARDLTLVVETPLPHLLGGQLDDFEWIVDRLPQERLGVCIDTSHCALGGFLLDAIQRFARRTIHIQVSDNGGSSDDHWAPGDGVLDWPRIRAALAHAGYNGVFMLEVSGDGSIEPHVERAVGAARRILA